MIPFYFKIAITLLLTFLYTIYLVELYQHITNPERLLPHKQRKHRKRLFVIFILAILVIIGIIATIRQFVLPRPIFDLIVVSLELMFLIPFFGIIFADLLLHTWPHRYVLARILNILNILLPACIAITTNLLILFAAQETIESIAYVLNITTDIATVGVISTLGFLGVAHWRRNRRK